ncbi:WD40 repeat domain-containing protein [Actinomadura scrupuli]|uniref:WD40 repeat domain-containing protein n=1 Tax=Actinomadura scrupuli TaxID=559629 RepID=UPI003D958B79
MSGAGPGQDGTIVISSPTDRAVGPSLLTLSPQGEMLLAARLGDGTIGCWDAGSGEQRWRVPDDSGAFSLTVIRPPGGRMLLASGGEEGVYRWDLLTGEPLPGNLSDGDTIWSVAAAALPDGRSILAGAGNDHLVYRWDAVTGQPIGEPLAGHRICVKSIDVLTLPGGVILIASGGEDEAIRFWDAVSGEPIGTALKGHSFQVSSLTSTTLPSGQILLASSDHEGDIRRWDAVTREPIGRPIHTARWGGPVIAGPAPGGARLFALCEDKIIRQFNPLTGALIDDSLHGNDIAVGQYPDGTTIIATSAYQEDITLQPLL